MFAIFFFSNKDGARHEILLRELKYAAQYKIQSHDFLSYYIIYGNWGDLHKPLGPGAPESPGSTVSVRCNKLSGTWKAKAELCG